MSSILQTQTTSFKTELYTGVHNLSTNTLKIALYTASADLNEATTVYSATNEVTGTGYVAGGVAVTFGTPPTATNASVTAGVAFVTPSASITYTSVTLATAFDAVLIYNSTQADKAVSVHTFGSQTVTAGTFTLTMPADTTTTALIRLATT
jgi:hypothetical protein